MLYNCLDDGSVVSFVSIFGRVKQSVLHLLNCAGTLFRAVQINLFPTFSFSLNKQAEPTIFQEVDGVLNQVEPAYGTLTSDGREKSFDRGKLFTGILRP